MHVIEERLAFVVLAGQDFTADDISEDGTWVLDQAHQPNGRNSSFGAHIQAAAQRGFIEPTGEIRQSCAPARKGGMVRVWRPTAAGLAWAQAEFTHE